MKTPLAIFAGLTLIAIYAGNGTPAFSQAEETDSEIGFGRFNFKLQRLCPGSGGVVD